MSRFLKCFGRGFLIAKCRVHQDIGWQVVPNSRSIGGCGLFCVRNPWKLFVFDEHRFGSQSCLLARTSHHHGYGLTNKPDFVCGQQDMSTHKYSGVVGASQFHVILCGWDWAVVYGFQAVGLTILTGKHAQYPGQI